MSLIEQLGGYAAAKRELELKEQDSILQCCASVTANMIRSAMLEYRRQHNIFEVGDKVVLKNNEQEGVLTVQMFKDDFIRAYLDDFKYSFGHQINFRHATDAEIAVGRRL